MTEILLNNEWLLIVFIILILYLGWRIRKAWKNFLFFLLKRKGKKGESIAFKILEKEGYKVLEEQYSLDGILHEDNIRIEYKVKPDFLVIKDGQKFIAEVKTGGSALIQNIATRRQLLEYSYLNKKNIILLIDIESRKIKKIDFS